MLSSFPRLSQSFRCSMSLGRRPLAPSRIPHFQTLQRSRFFSSTSSLQRVRYVRFEYPNPKNGRPGPPSPFFQSSTWPMKVGGVFVGVGVLYYVSHLEQVEETGRWRFMNVDPETEAQVGEMSRSQILSQFGKHILPPNHPVSLHVHRVVTQILEANGLGVIKNSPLSPQEHARQTSFDFFPDIFSGGTGGFGSSGRPSEKTVPHVLAGPQKQWEVVVVNEPKIVNAAATPGTVIVFTGILPVCKDEQGLAAVLSHEIGHVVARHTAERISSQLPAIALTLLLTLTGLDLGISALLQKFMIELTNSRTQEREADLIGLRLMSKACFDPAAAPAMFARLGRLEAEQGLKTPEFFRTHPTSENRVKILESHLPEAYDVFNANPECSRMREFRDMQRMHMVGAGSLLGM
ncbi:metalloendopeptidase [Stygiomarasmius scandens]|uniref:Metalloendopeptidase n=1 Tax=Marasmiellus scandens TaxID=2682957 RepID=A0ABR1J8S3_9AGAR